MDIYKRFGISSSFLDAIQSVTEKKALDPVDPKQAKGTFQARKDKDIDNDGDTDKTDKYLHSRRNAITKAMSEKKKGSKDKVDLEPKLDDKDSMRGVQEAERRADVKMVKVRNPDGTMSFRKERPEIKVEEVEIDELSKGTLASYAKKASRDARIKMATGKDFERHAKTSRKPEYKAGAKSWEDKYKSDARRREAGVHKAIDRLAKEEVEEIDELSPETHRSYQGKARASLYKKVRPKPEPGSPEAKAISIKGLKRMGGIERSKQKQISSISTTMKSNNEEVEEIDELSKGALASYAKKRTRMLNKAEKDKPGKLNPKIMKAIGARDFTGYSDKEHGRLARQAVSVDRAKERIKSRLNMEDADITQEDIDFINELNKVDELDKKTLDKYTTRARFSSNPKHQSGALKAMDRLKKKSKNEK